MLEIDDTYATDKDIYDLLLSSKLKLTDKIIREFALERGIIFSPEDDKRYMAENLSITLFSYHDIKFLIEKGTINSRQEKLTSTTIKETKDSEITLLECKKLLNQMNSQMSSYEESIVSHINKNNELDVTVQYIDIDYSKTALLQKQKKQFKINISKKNNELRLLAPANDKSNEIISKLKEAIEETTKTTLNVEKIDLQPLYEKKLLSDFFVKLITSIPNNQLDNVTNLRVSNTSKTETSDMNFDDENEDIESAKALGMVNDILMKGSNLVSSDEYQTLRERGYIITSISWETKEKKDLYNKLSFSAEFDKENKTFKFLPKGFYNNKNGTYTKSLKPLEDHTKIELCNLIEQVAKSTINKLLSDPS